MNNAANPACQLAIGSCPPFSPMEATASLLKIRAVTLAL